MGRHAKQLPLKKHMSMKQKTICFIGFFYIRNVTLPLTCIHTAFAKLDGGSAIQNKILRLLFCIALALH